ncbi:hypothetical protein [Chroococcidiopsis sp. CCNUC1]|nr:hypothetical protein [Chroococcidiopsis sp. CCNUC1]URD53776.1 hypothetical protein M5J74_32290 [Chroococcidiopsis sp. CCNUC1]
MIESQPNLQVVGNKIDPTPARMVQAARRPIAEIIADLSKPSRTNI